MLNNKHGITLIELLVALALVGLVLSICFSIFFFSNKTFSKGEDQSAIQSDFRLAADFVKSEMRNSEEVEIVTLDQIPNIDNGYKYLYVEDNTLKYKATASGFSPISKTSQIIDSVNPNFSIIEENGKYLLTILFLDNSVQSYQVEAKVLFKNLLYANLSSGYAIKYR